LPLSWFMLVSDMRRAVAILIGLGFLGPAPAIAQSDDLFRSAEPPASLGPSYDPFQMTPADPPPAPAKWAPRPRPVPEPEPVLATPPPPLAPPPTPFDGIWIGTYSCEAFGDKPSLTYRVIMEIKNGSWSRLNALTSTPGQLGYDHYEAGPTSADGHVMLTRTAIGDGRLPGDARLGEVISCKFVGMFRGSNFIAWGDRGRCRIQLSRQL
jgi:hypothetical protein